MAATKPMLATGTQAATGPRVPTEPAEGQSGTASIRPPQTEEAEIEGGCGQQRQEGAAGGVRKLSL